MALRRRQELFVSDEFNERSHAELKQKLARMDLHVDENHFYTSALATAKFLATQDPDCSAYVIGAPGLLNALYQAGITMNDIKPRLLRCRGNQNV
jgi:NagD protein